MNKSDSIKNLAAALCKAQGVMEGAIKDKENPFFGKSYADLGSVVAVIKKPFADNGLSYSQFPVSDGDNVGVDTILMHESGEWISTLYYLPMVKRDPQKAGSAITYARRYALQAIAGIPNEDDDGNAASQPQTKVTKPAARTQRKLSITPTEYWKLSAKDQSAKWQVLDQPSKDKILASNNGG